MKYNKWDFPNYLGHYLGFGVLLILCEVSTKHCWKQKEFKVHQDDSHWPIFISKWATVRKKAVF